MTTVLTIIGTIFCLLIVPVATILGLIGYWIFDFWGSLFGVIIGLLLQFGDS